MIIHQASNDTFPGRNHGLITVLIKKGGQQGNVQLSFDLFEKDSAEKITE